MAQNHIWRGSTLSYEVRRGVLPAKHEPTIAEPPRSELPSGYLGGWSRRSVIPHPDTSVPVQPNSINYFNDLAMVFGVPGPSP